MCNPLTDAKRGAAFAASLLAILLSATPSPGATTTALAQPPGRATPGPGPTSTTRSRPPAQSTPGRARPTSAAEFGFWSAEYTAAPAVPVEEGAISMALRGEQTCLATETEVSRYAHGVWVTLGAPADVSRIFALAAAADGLWATGLEGAAWRRDDASGRWQRMTTDTAADLYSVAADGSAVWAVGFDYQAEQGVIAYLSPGAPPVVYQPAALAKKQLSAVALDPSGERWVGGCDYLDHPLLMRDQRRGEWTSVPLTLAKGCVYQLDFAAGGSGLAAAGLDILVWDGNAWLPAGASPPEGTQWVRVAAMEGGEAAASVLHASGAGAPPFLRGWALAGQPTWRGFTEGQLPWYFDGARWWPGGRPPQGPLRPSDASIYVGLAGDGKRAAALSRPLVEGQTMVQTELLRLADGEVTLAHPLLDRIPPGERNLAGDVAASGGAGAGAASGTVWVAARGPVPFLGRSTDAEGLSAEWEPAASSLFELTGTLRMQLLDLANPADGWAVGGLSGVPGQRVLAWHWDGRSWDAMPAPPGPASGTTQLRSVPGGRAWAVGPGRRLAEFDPASGSWQQHPDWPAVVAPATLPSGPLTSTRPITTLMPLMAPFDAARDGEGRTVGYLAAADGYYRLESAPGQAETVTRSQDPTRGIVADLQLVTAPDGAVMGWAMATDPSPHRPGDFAAVLLRLTRGGQWEEVSRLPSLLREFPALQDVEWRLMSAADAEEVWLLGELRSARLQTTSVIMRFELARGWSLVAACSAAAIAAQPVENGTDLWLLGAGGAGCQPRLGAIGSGGSGGVGMQPRPPDPLPLSPIVSRIAIRREVGRVFLPRVIRR